MIDFILDLIYPNVCGFCGKINNESLCNECEEKINPKLVCNIDKYEDKFFSEHLYLFKYEENIRKSILEYKFNDKDYLYKTFSKIIIKNEKICGFLIKYYIIIPVPIHKKRFNVRGYNQSELIAKEIAKNIKSIKFENNILFKIQNTNPQSTLNKLDRSINAQNAYSIKNSERFKNKNILLLDDIYTTGSTVNECSRILKLNNSKDIGIITLAKD